MPFLNGQYVVTPGASVEINDAALLAPASAPGLGLLLIGPAADGKPQQALTLSSPAQAVALLKGGDLLQAALLAFNPSTESRGPQTITVIRPEQATQATAVLKSAGGVTQVNLTTTSYGLPANQAKIQTQAGATAGYTVTLGSDYVGIGGQTYRNVVGPNVSLFPISIYYSGTGTSPTYTVSDTQLVLTATTSDVGGTITFPAGMTVQQLVNQINQFTGWNASVTDPNPGRAVASLFDNVASALAVSTSSAAPTSLTAHVAAVVAWINQTGAYFTATRASGATSIATGTGWTYASGALAPTAANSDWQNAYTVAQSIQNIAIVVPVIGSASIWAMNDAHCQYMASIGQPRRGYVGDVTGQTVAQEIANAQALNSSRTTLVWPGTQGTDMNGNAATLASYLVSAQVSGARAGTLPPGKITATSISATGLETTLTPAQVAQLNAGGVAALTQTSQGTIDVSWDRTTWLQSGAYDKVENLTGITLDEISQQVNAILQSFVGQPVTASLLGHISGEILGALKNAYQRGLLSSQPKATDVTLTASGQVVSGAVNVAVVVPANYIAITLNATSFAV